MKPKKRKSKNECMCIECYLINLHTNQSYYRNKIDFNHFATKQSSKN